MFLTHGSRRLIIRSLKTILSLSILVIALEFLLVHRSHSSDSIVNLDYVAYAGNRASSNTIVYLGVPYAEPPLGDLRFRSPVPLNTTRIHQGSKGRVVGARWYPEPCIQGATDAGELGGAGTEDCLRLNVYVPSGTEKNDRLPVLVYIHGGGYVNGNPANWPFEHWVDQVPHVVIVSIYYRLNSFGFLSHPAFLIDPSLGDLNVGLQDQIEALRWIQKHIYAFGGDPGRVTINGQSAGATSVLLHLVNQRNAGLFHAAIAQSVYRTPIPTASQQEALFDALSEEVGCGIGSVHDRVACLRRASTSALARAQDATFLGRLSGHYHIFRPVQDPRSLPETPTVALLNGRFKRIPLIVGSTSNESYTSETSISAALKVFFPQTRDTDVRDLLTRYPASAFASYAQRLYALAGDSQFICGRVVLGGEFAKAPNHQVWTYRFNQPDPTTGNVAVEHSADNYMMFKGVGTKANGTAIFTPFGVTTSEFSEELIAYWLSFVRSGDPNAHKLHRSPHWPEYSVESQRSKVRLVLQEGHVGESGSYLELEGAEESERCKVVAGMARVQQN